MKKSWLKILGVNIMTSENKSSKGRIGSRLDTGKEELVN